MSLDFFLRFTWTLTISPGTFGEIMRPELFMFILGSLEMLRRAIWNFVLIERIFISNLESYKCLYEYKLPYESDILEEKQREKSELSTHFEQKCTIKKKKPECFASCDCDDEWKLKLGTPLLKGENKEEIKSINNGNDY